MSLRIFLFGVLWLGAMFLLFLTPVSESQHLFFDLIPSRSFIHFILFWGFVHLWIGALKKQHKYEILRRRAFLIVFISALVLAILSEVIILLAGYSTSISFWNLLFDVLGSALGLLTFRVLYAQCY